jgi:hypothetical protein
MRFIALIIATAALFNLSDAAINHRNISSGALDGVVYGYDKRGAPVGGDERGSRRVGSISEGFGIES